MAEKFLSAGNVAPYSFPTYSPGILELQNPSIDKLYSF